MMRSLWTGASGMIAQQSALDTISNNLANVNTTGYKKETVEFKSLLYSKLQTKTTDNNGDPKPVIGQVGAGVRVASVTSRFVPGSLQETGNVLDFAIDGNGFFQVQMPDGTTAYTRNGALNASIGVEGLTLCTSDGYPILDTNGEPIVFDNSIDVSRLSVDEDGRMFYQPTGNAGEDGAEDNSVIDLGIRIGLVQFNNPSGLEKLSGSLYAVSDASGEPRLEAEETELKSSRLISRYLEASNVQTVDEIVNLIVAQRAYEMNSKVITASDEMLQQANNLRG